MCISYYLQYTKYMFINVLLYPQTCPPYGRRPGRKRICRCRSCHRSPPEYKQAKQVTNISMCRVFWHMHYFSVINKLFCFFFDYLLPRADVCIDIFEHRFQCCVVPHAQVLDLDLSLSGPAVRDLIHS